MAKVNTKTKTPAYEGVTHEGAPAKKIGNLARLKRSVLSCFLWEREFYEDDEEIAKRIVDLAGNVQPSSIATLAIQARNQFKLRHVPLLLTAALCKHASGTRLVSDTVPLVVRRADELAELLAIYQKLNGKDAPLSKQLKLGLAKAFENFDEYQLAKYDREGEIRLRDVMFLVHPKPGARRGALYKRIADRQLKTPDTWEVELSAGADKKETFERLIREEKLGYLALLRNLRNMIQAGCDRKLVQDAIVARKGAQNVLPFRYTAAARAAPSLEAAIDQALCEAISEIEPLSGTTAILVDVSPSMDAKLSAKSDMSRADAAATLASIIPGDVRVFSFTNNVVEVPPRRGMAGVDAVMKSQSFRSGTLLGKAINHVNSIEHDRLIVVTDEQSQDTVGDPKAKRAYMINVASARNGVGYGQKWVNITGFSENVLRFIREHELG